MTVAFVLLIIVLLYIYLRTAGGYLFLPAIRIRGKRYRTKIRTTSRCLFHKETKVYQEGTLHRLWIAWLLVICMVDDGSGRAQDVVKDKLAELGIEGPEYE